MNKKLTLACISFLRLDLEKPVFIPDQVDQLSKSRIRHQYRELNPDLELRFDDSSCTYKGEYHYQISSLVMTASVKDVWDGRVELNITDIIEGKTLALPKVFQENSPVISENTLENKSQTTAIRSPQTGPGWFTWSLLGVVTGVAIYAITKSSPQAKAANQQASTSYTPSSSTNTAPTVMPTSYSSSTTSPLTHIR